MHPSSAAHATPQSATPVLAARQLVKDFGPVRALDRVDFELHAGEVHAVMGENGAGKSTLVRILTGLHQPTAGRLALNDQAVELRSARQAENAGIAAVFQELDLVPTLSVADNIGLGRQPTRLGLIRWRAMRRRAQAALARLGLDLDVRRPLADYSIGTQQLVAIARALDAETRVLILDEPTSSLDRRETQVLFDVLRSLRGRGLAILLITHFLDQVFEIADRVTVLRNGSRVGVWPLRELTHARLVEAMTGRSFELTSPQHARSEGSGAPAGAVLEARNVGRRNVLAPASLSIGSGDALGLAGLLGSGRTELARLLFGADKPDSGAVRVNGDPVRLGSIPDAVRSGMGFLPENRAEEGLIPDLSVRENIVLALQARRGALKPVPRAEQHRLADHYIAALNIRAPSAHAPVSRLSGGNQQKVLLARWLATQPRILILDEPTRGIDVGARAEIEALIGALRRQGLAILLVSAELDEIVRTCSRVLVLRDRRPVGELAGDQISEHAVLACIAGEPGDRRTGNSGTGES